MIMFKDDEWILLTTTAGELLVRQKDIHHIVGMPDESTCMVYLNTDETFETSGSLHEVWEKIR